MKKYKGYLIDLDGTMYKGGEGIFGAILFVKALYQKGIPYLFLTNNAAKTQKEIAKQLQGYGILCEPRHVFTSAMAAAEVIAKEKPNAAVYMIGEAALEAALREKGLLLTHIQPDYVVMGLDRQLTYEKLVKGALALQSGAKLISTNQDVAIPTEHGLIPGNGALTKVLQVSINAKPQFIGKPEAPIMQQALQVLGTKCEETLLIGDNYQTDIMAGIHFGMDTLCVFTGVTSREVLAKKDRQPTYCTDDLEEWIVYL